MESREREALEAEIRSLCAQADTRRAAEVAIRGYGPEIFSFLLAFHGREQDAADVFSLFIERLWKGLEAFGWECTFRTWAYTLARNTSHTFRVHAKRHADRHPELPSPSYLSEIADRVRTETLSYIKTANKDRMRALRETLSPEDQMLLTLRVDRELAWDEVARVMHDVGSSPSDDALRKASARLRQRFQTLKDRLIELARREGILRDRGPRRRA